jgi:hypothetical protein
VNSFKAFASILLLFAFTAQTFHQGAIVLSYYLDSSAYAQNCENKAKPAMHCEGKCQMIKELQKEEQKNDQRPARKLGDNTEVISSKSYFATSLREVLTIPNRQSSIYKGGFSRDIEPDIFHPPA